MSIDQSLSLYIPRVTRRMTDLFITETIEKMGLGCVGKVDLVETADGRQMTAYVHFANWADTSENRQLQQRIKDPTQQARLVYDAPWYWILLVNKNPEPKPVKKTVSFATPEKTTTKPTAVTTNPVVTHTTFADVLRGTTVRPPPPISIDADALHRAHLARVFVSSAPTPEDIAEMTQMAEECDDEWNNTLKARNSVADTDEPDTHRLNQQLQAIICDLQTRLAWCEQMCVNTAFQVENSNDAIASMSTTNFRTIGRLNNVDARLEHMEYDMLSKE
jgi:hypothetical protein